MPLEGRVSSSERYNGCTVAGVRSRLTYALGVALATLGFGVTLFGGGAVYWLIEKWGRYAPVGVDAQPAFAAVFMLAIGGGLVAAGAACVDAGRRAPPVGSKCPEAEGRTSSTQREN